MASIATSQWAGGSSPQCRFNVWQTGETGNTVTFGWSMEYVAHGYAAYTNGIARNYKAFIDGAQVVNQNYNINGVSSTVQIASGSYTVSKHTYARNVSLSCSFYFDVTWSGYYAGTLSASGSISIPAKNSYTVSYNANGGTGAPGSQIKWYGDTLKLSSTKPTRTGYTFQGWATSASGSVAYQPGANYTSNAGATLYAVWKANTFIVSYNANGGSGAPANQTKTYGVTLKLSSTIPTRDKYNFLGWGTSSSSTTISYAPGSNYTNNAAITLYAIWELAYTDMVFDNFEVYRCNDEGVAEDEGEYIKVTFSWAKDPTYTDSNPHVYFSITQSGGNSEGTGYQLEDSSGTFEAISQKTYDMETDVVGYVLFDVGYDYTQPYFTISPKFYTMDFLYGGQGVAFGKPASNPVFEVDMPAWFNKNVEIKKNIRMAVASSINSSNYGDKLLECTTAGRLNFTNHFSIGNGIWLQGELASGTKTNILRMNEDNQVELNWTTGGLKGRVMKELWRGTLSKGGSVTISELPYYNVFAFKFTEDNMFLIGLRSYQGNVIHFVNGSDTGTKSYIFMGKAEVSGTKFTLVAASGHSVNALANQEENVPKTISLIYGLL